MNEEFHDTKNKKIVRRLIREENDRNTFLLEREKQNDMCVIDHDELDSRDQNCVNKIVFFFKDIGENLVPMEPNKKDSFVMIEIEDFRKKGIGI